MTDRLIAFGTQLLDIHARLREQLDQIMDAAHDDPGAGIPPELLTHCLTFCSALDRHHTGEDAHAFPALAAEFPELEPVLEQLRQDHRMLAHLLGRLDATARRTDVDPQTLRTDLDGISALMDSHFRFEEKRIVDALNKLGVDLGPAAKLLGYDLSD
ncbi:MAG: hemerythrin domain-containing protein [Hamadaea sp.]|nr:hemerythrin domain-containing protein [Hamadaea sp.]